jgi:hypothetical protein
VSILDFRQERVRWRQGQSILMIGWEWRIVAMMSLAEALRSVMDERRAPGKRYELSVVLDPG